MKHANSFPEFLKSARENVGLTQAEVADHLNYGTSQFISNWERGMSSPPIKAIPKIAKLYRISSNDLFEGILKLSLELTEQSFRREYQSIRKKG